MSPFRSARARVIAVREAFRTQLWPLPAAGTLLGLALGVALPRLDAHVDQDLSAGTTVYLFGGGPSAARELLGAVSGSLITVTSLTFSLTVVTLQLASSQFSPRLLRTFTRDRVVHVTLALFLTTFTYSLAVLRTVRDENGDQAAFVPQISVTLAFILGVASVLGLVIFLGHLARELRVDTMLRKVHRDATRTVARVLDERGSGESQPRVLPPDNALLLTAGASGFLVNVDEKAVLAAAVAADAVVAIDRCPGSSLVESTPIGHCWPRVDRAEPEDLDVVRRRVADAITTGFERTDAQDVLYGLRQLTDVAVKALSPGINDPTTAISALGHSSALLRELADRDLQPRLLYDDDGEIRAVIRRPGFADALELAMEQPRRYGASDPAVLARLFELLAELAWHVREPRDHALIAEQLERLRATAGNEDFDRVERERLDRLGDHVAQAQAGHWHVG